MASPILRRRSSLLSFGQDKSGGVIVYVALIAAAAFGIIGLAVDVSRALVVHSESRAAADAAALAAASQLDGTPTAITRANNAIANLVSNQQRLASTGAGAVGIANVQFLSGLPADDSTPIGAGLVTTNPLEARFVEVTTAPLTHLNTFLLAVGAGDTAPVTTQAVGGGHQMVCHAQPLMICNPDEQGAVGAPFNLNNWRGHQIRLVSQTTGAMTPGNFGFLTSGDTGANALREALASTAGANICYGPYVETEPGLQNGVRNGLNVRFGIYLNPGFGGGASNNPLYAPDVNVRTMPRDTSFAAGRFGNGHWNCQAYWTANFGASGVQKPAACVADTTALSRYEMYQFEVANNLSQLPPQNAANRLANRRIVYVAVVNCLEESVNGRVTVPFTTILKVFITEPVTQPSNVEIYGEVVDVVQLGVDDTVLHEIVQLYR
jgi:Flp pilus assembly protein TadG